jgi:hypothetical protein
VEQIGISDPVLTPPMEEASGRPSSQSKVDCQIIDCPE